jgi:RNA polymerase sigma-70 factor (ECF subfamily)
MDQGRLNQESFERLMAGLRPRLHRYCARMIGSAIDGEDVVQEALASAAEAFPTAGPILRPESWLFRIAHNAALDALRRRRRQTAIASDAADADAAMSPIPALRPTRASRRRRAWRPSCAFRPLSAQARS